MNKKQFRNSHYEIPEHSGSYQWKMCPGHYIHVQYIDGEWYTMAGNPLGQAVIYWR